MILYLWLDDVRDVPEVCVKYPVRDEPEFGMNTYITYVVRSVESAIYILDNAVHQKRYDGYLLDLDHDLGDYAKDGGDGYELIKRMIDRGYTTNKFKIRIHSLNPVGRQNMDQLIDRYFDKE